VRRALVTGAGSASGIGFATARLLAAQGYSVVVSSTTERVFTRADELGGRGVVADLTSWDDARRLVAEAGPVDVLVNNAGMVQTGVETPDRLFTELAPEEWERGIDLNLHTAARMCRLVAPGMGGGGRIVNVSSVTGPYAALPGTAAYGAAKAGVLSLTQSLAIEWAPKVRVVAVSPGLVRTEQSELHYGDEKGIAAVSKTVPLGRMSTPEEIGDACVWLSSPQAAYVSGTNLVMHGGGESPAFLSAANVNKS